ncbi:FxSxx-COOH system tetratricopeptide repeat protein [Streptomyces sp. NPDC048481]|uniref:FxSxx-COOH system tetratricopeptide repeat protein n=1 Tax=Streptomyces sp. NPDC048481 TaxID=3365557 RepID=UPI0037122862
MDSDCRADFFISYHAANRQWAEWIGSKLESSSYSVIVQDWDFKPGEDLIERKNQALETCRRILAVVGHAYLTAPISRQEWTAAFLQNEEDRGRLLCLRVEDCDLPALLRPLGMVDLVGLDEVMALAALRRGVATGRSRPASVTYPGARDTSAGLLRFPAELPRIFEVPPRNHHFTGRLGSLARLQKQLTDSVTVVQAALYGLGGIGKSQIATEYSYRNAASYDLVWWLPAEKPAIMQSGYARLAEELGIGMTTSQPGLRDALFRELKRRGRWLLVYDNAEQPDDVYPLPSGGHVLITSRNPNWEAVAATIALDVLSGPEAEAFLTKRIRSAAVEGTQEIRDLARRLGRLPLALEQAAAYVDAADITVGDYLALLGESAADALAAKPPLGYSRSVADTWMLSLEQIKKLSPDGYRLLTFCAFLGPDMIPRRLLATSHLALPPHLGAVVGSKARYQAAVMHLRRYSLITTSSEEISLHRLVQWVVRQRAAGFGWSPAHVVEDAVAWLLQVFPVESGELENAALCEALLPHVLAVRDRAAEYDAPRGDLAVLLERAAVFLHAQARLAASRDLFETAWEIGRRLPQADPFRIRLQMGHGRLLQELGQVAGARAAYEEIEASARSGPAAAAPLLAMVLIDMGRLLQEEGLLGPARERIQEALDLMARFEAPVGDRARAEGILGRIQQDLGNIHEARSAYEDALALSIGEFGLRDSRVALRRNNLAGALHLAGRVTEAREQLSIALTTLEDVYGRDHDRTVAVRLNLGTALHALGEYPRARQQYEHARAICEGLALPDDLRIAMISTGLGSLCHDDGDLSGARMRHDEALSAGRGLHEASHPRMVVIAANAAATLERTDELDRAGGLAETALAAAVKLYGKCHPRVAAVRSTWALLLGRGGDFPSARAQAAQALADSERVYGSGHNRIAVIENNLGWLAWLESSGAAASVMAAHFGRAVAAAEASYGPAHPRAAVIRANLRSSMTGTTDPVPLFVPLQIHQQATTIDR